MSIAKDTLRAILARRDPRVKAIEAQCVALGLVDVMPLSEGMDSVRIDAAEEIGCKPDDIDLTRDHHVKVLTDAMVSMAADYIAAHPGSTGSSQSSYLKKAP